MAYGLAAYGRMATWLPGYMDAWLRHATCVPQAESHKLFGQRAAMTTIKLPATSAGFFVFGLQLLWAKSEHTNSTVHTHIQTVGLHHGIQRPVKGAFALVLTCGSFFIIMGGWLFDLIAVRMQFVWFKLVSNLQGV